MKKTTHVPVIPTSPIELLKIMVRPYKWKTFAFFTLTFLGSFAWIASPVAVAKIITNLSENPVVGAEIWYLVFIYAVLRVIDEVLWRLGELVMKSYKPEMIESVRTNLYSAILRRPHSFFVDSSSGRVAHWINQTTNTVNETVDTTIWTVWGRLIALIVSAFFLFTAHWSLGLLFVVWLVLLFSYNIWRGRTYAKLIASYSDEVSKVAGTVVDSVSNNLSIRVYNAQRREIQLVTKQQNAIVRTWRAGWSFNIVTNIVKGQSAAVASVLALVVSMYLFSKGFIELGGVVLFIAYFGDASSALWMLAWSFDSYFRNYGSIKNALDGLHGENERSVQSDSPIKTPKKVSLELQDLSFAYSDQPEIAVLNNISIKIPNGSKVGLVGHSGAGKSTLVSLLLGLHEPTSGEIIINEKLAKLHDPSFLRAFSAYVPQDTALFNRSVKENVSYAVPGATDKQVKHALKKAEALEFVNNLTSDMDTVIGERGVKLSGGQRQRIAIARAVLQDAPLILLDEATSALDSVSEQAIQKALYDIMQKRTAIVIAHRLSTLKHLDLILVIEGGEIAEQGTHESLIKQNGVYADLWKRQKDGFIAE